MGALEEDMDIFRRVVENDFSLNVMVAILLIVICIQNIKEYIRPDNWKWLSNDYKVCTYNK